MRYNLRSILELILFVGIYLAMFNAVQMWIASVVVAIGIIRFCRRGLSLSRSHAAVLGIAASSLHLGVVFAVFRARVVRFDLPLQHWASWRYGGGWPSVIGYGLHGAYYGLILGLAVVVGFLFFSRLSLGTPGVAKRFIATTTWFVGTYLGTIGTIRLSDFVLDFFYGETPFIHPLSNASAVAIGYALVWAAFKLPSWLSNVEHWLRRET